MLAKRIIPCLDVDRGRVVKGIRFVSLVDAGDASATADGSSLGLRRITRSGRRCCGGDNAKPGDKEATDQNRIESDVVRLARG